MFMAQLLLMGMRMSGGEFGRQHGHGSVAGADVGGGAHGQRMGLGNAFAPEYGGYEGCGEAVARAHRVGNLYMGCGLERDVAGCEHIAAVDAACENEHPEVVFAEKYPAFVLKVDSGVAEHTADYHEFLIVDFQNVAALHGVAENFLVVESLTKVHVKDRKSVVGAGHRVEKPVDGFARHHIALCERAEAHGLGVLGEGVELRSVGDIVPGYILLDFILRYACGVDFHLYGACGVGHFGDKMVEALGGEVFQEFLSEGIGADSAYHTARQAELRDVIGEIGGRTAYFFTFRKNVPQGFAHSYNKVFHVDAFFEVDY